MDLIAYPNIVLLFILAVCIMHIQGAAYWLEYELAGFDNSDGSLFKTNLKSKRYDKSSFAISGTLEILSDFSNDWETEVNLFHSARGNNQFVKLPYKVPKDDVCNIVDGIYIKCGAAKDVAATSNLPAPVPDESLCASYKAGNYTIQQYVLAKSIIPKFLQPGYYKAQVLSNKKNSEESQSIVLHVKLY